MNRLPTLPLLLALLAPAIGGQSPPGRAARAAGAASSRAQANPGGSSLPAPWRRLAFAEQSLAKALFQRDPWLALEREWRTTPPGLGRYDPDWNAYWSGLLEAFSTDLGAIRPNDLGAERNIDYEWLRAWLRTETILAHSQASSRWNPAFYVQRVRQVLLAIEDTPTLDAEQRKALTLSALSEVPRLFRTAVRGLVAPARELSAEAVVSLADLMGYVNELDPGTAEEGWSDAERARFLQAREAAVEACQTFRTWLAEDAVKTGTPTTTMGRRNWENAVSELVGRELDAHLLRGELLREFARLDRSLGEQRVLRPAAPELFAEDALRERMEAVSKLATAGLVLAGVLDPKGLPPLELEVHVRRGQSLPHELVRVRPEAEHGSRLWVETHGIAWPEPVSRTRAALLWPAAQDVLAIRYGYPGESLLRSAASVNDSVAQRFLWNRATLEGWGLYAVDLVERLGASLESWGRDEGHGIEATRSALLEVARVIAAIELHAEELPLEEVVESFADRTGCDPLTAGFEVRRAMGDPFLGVGYLTYREFKAFERETAGGFARPEQLRRLLDALIAHPAARVSDLRTIMNTPPEAPPTPNRRR